MSSIAFASHILEQTILAEELVSRGHQVYIAIGSRYPKLENIEEKGIKTIQYKIPDDVLYGVSQDMERVLSSIIFNNDEEGRMIASCKLTSTISYRDCDYMMNDEHFLEEVRRLSFDLAIVDPFIIAPCNLILPKVLEIPFVSMTWGFDPWKHGIPALPSFAPLIQAWTSLSDITIMSRLKNLLMFAFGDVFISMIAPQNMTLLEKYAPEFKDWYELNNLSQLFFILTGRYFGAVMPQLPNYISVAGLSTSKAKKLPDDLGKLAESSEYGIILLSFGSSAYYFPTDVIIKFLNAFAKLKQTVLVKFNIPENASVPSNVKALSWLPQNDILGHPKTKLFITHCGNSGLHEALYHGVPMIGFPLFGEQDTNCQNSYQRGFGLKMDIKDFTSEELVKSIDEVLNISKYRDVIRKASDAFRDQPMHPRDVAAFWIEHVIRHGGGHLRPLSMDMPTYQFLMLDVLVLLLVLLLVIFTCFVTFVKFIFRRFSLSKKFRLSFKHKSN